MKLSIITINYNNLEGLKKTAESVIFQTWRDFEWILIDGGSTDGSKEYVEQLSICPENNITYWCSERDNGIYNAMNKGIDKARGKYLNFLNSGDVYYSQDSLNMVYPYLLEKDADVYYGDLVFTKEKYSEVFHYPDNLSTHYLLCRSIGHPASFINSDLLKREKYREDFRIVSDWLAFIKWFGEGRRFMHIHHTLAIFDANGISNTNEELLNTEHEQVYVELFGKNNLQWIYESIEMQQLKEIIARINFDALEKIIFKGGIRLKLLSVVLRILK